MTTYDLIEAATPSIIRAPWCEEMNRECMGVLVEDGDFRAAAAKLDRVAEHRKLSIVEICRVQHGTIEAVFARGDAVATSEHLANPFIAPETDPA